jgi:putative tryptophan/tyrosine transport system ATP-binding protein
MIEFINLKKTFEHKGRDRVTALDSINITIKEGEFITVIGTNGSGKSSFLNAIAGKFLPDSGKMMLNGQNYTNKPEHIRATLIGRVFQNPFTGTSPGLTIMENIRIAELRGLKRGLKSGLTSANRKRYQAILKNLEMGLGDRINATVGLLSGGQRQAVTLLMATLTKPRILLLDEHTAALDPQAAEQIIKLTRKFVEESQSTTVMITHSMIQALELGDRTIMMHRGKIIGDLSGAERKNTKPQDLLNRFAEIRKEEMLDNELISMLQEGYY